VGFAEIRHNQKHRYALPIVLGMLAVLVVGMTCFQLASKTSPENRMLLHISLMLMIALCVVILLLYRTVKERNWITLLFALQIIAVIAGAFVLRLGNEAVIPVILILGTMESLVGLFLLTRFTKRYPVLENAD
jgi:cell division protein FtsW (lipid II flippase)